MKAFVRDRYGSPDVLRLADVPEPEVGDGAVLVRVRATSVNAHDWHMLRGKPYIARTSEGLRRPHTRILGLDVAGVVEAVGDGVTDLQVGDRVFGNRSGSWAELVATRNVVRMPDRLSFEEAAAIPVAGQTALQGLRDRARLVAGERVLVVGAGGGVGTMAVQIARALGACVHATTRAETVELVESLGAERVIDHARADVTRGRERYDVIFDVGGRHRLSALRRILAPGGRAVLTAPQPGQWVGPIVRVAGAVVGNRLGGRPVHPFLSAVSKDDIATLRDMVDAGQLLPVIDRVVEFAQLPEAVRLLEDGHPRGKVVIRLPDGV